MGANLKWWQALIFIFILFPLGIIRSILGLDGKADETKPDEEKQGEK